MRKTLAKLLLFVTLPFLFANNVKAQFPGEEGFKFKVDTTEINNVIGKYGFKKGIIFYKNLLEDTSCTNIKSFWRRGQYYKVENGVVKEEIIASAIKNFELVDSDNNGTIDKSIMYEYNTEGDRIASFRYNDVKGDFDSIYNERKEMPIEFGYFNPKGWIIKGKFDEKGNPTNVSTWDPNLYIKGAVIFWLEKKESKSSPE